MVQQVFSVQSPAAESKSSQVKCSDRPRPHQTKPDSTGNLTFLHNGWLTPAVATGSGDER